MASYEASQEKPTELPSGAFFFGKGVPETTDQRSVSTAVR